MQNVRVEYKMQAKVLASLDVVRGVSFLTAEAQRRRVAQSLMPFNDKKGTKKIPGLHQGFRPVISLNDYTASERLVNVKSRIFIGGSR